MILLASISDLLEITTGSAQSIQIHASYVDYNGSTATGDCLNTTVASATTTTLVPSPLAGVVRDVKTLSIRNTDATNPDTITIIHTDGTTPVQINGFSLLAGYTLLWSDEEGFILLDAAGVQA